MSEAAAAQTAIAQLNGADLHGRTLNVNEARPKSTNGGSGARRLGSGGSRGRERSRW
jgi:RNA recognition motif-containing protein